MYSVEITRFSSIAECEVGGAQFCTLLKLQGSQAGELDESLKRAFCTLLKLQGSQATPTSPSSLSEFCTLLKLQGSQA